MKVMLDFKSDKQLEKNDILVFQNGHWTNVRKDEFLMAHSKEIEELKKKNWELEEIQHKHWIETEKLFSHDLFIAKSIYDNYIERGLIDENSEFDQKFYDFVFNGKELLLEDYDPDFKNILDKVRA